MSVIPRVHGQGALTIQHEDMTQLVLQVGNSQEDGTGRLFLMNKAFQQNDRDTVNEYASV